MCKIYTRSHNGLDIDTTSEAEDHIRHRTPEELGF